MIHKVLKDDTKHGNYFVNIDIFQHVHTLFSHHLLDQSQPSIQPHTNQSAKPYHHYILIMVAHKVQDFYVLAACVDVAVY